MGLPGLPVVCSVAEEEVPVGFLERVRLPMCTCGEDGGMVGGTGWFLERVRLPMCMCGEDGGMVGGTGWRVRQEGETMDGWMEACVDGWMG
eukprot:349720-Chlamydomonas_euryale.AAC.3